jgi:xanthine dehydrogenase YagT iron-sulfur-binding subunit
VERAITLIVNGERHRVYTQPRKTPLEVIQDNLGLNGTKEGCGRGKCEACTVLSDGKATVACLVLAVDADGREITTIEGLARGNRLHSIQKASPSVCTIESSS